MVCGDVLQVSEAKELVGQDGWATDVRDLRFGDWVQSSTEELQWQLLQEAQVGLLGLSRCYLAAL